MIAFTFNNQNIIKSAWFAAVSAVTIVTMLAFTFFIAEPTISIGQSDTATFRIRQTITDETAFLVDPSNVTMVGSINGLTGGMATGTTPFVVQSNNASGYYVEIDYFDNGTAHAMSGDDDDSQSIRDYASSSASGMQPTYTFATAAFAQFAYTIMSSTTLDNDQSFLNNNSNICNTGSTQTLGRCWMAPSTTAYRIIDRDTAAASGATSTLFFRVHVPNAPSPALTAQTYTATATLSVFTQ